MTNFVIASLKIHEIWIAYNLDSTFQFVEQNPRLFFIAMFLVFNCIIGALGTQNKNINDPEKFRKILLNYLLVIAYMCSYIFVLLWLIDFKL